MTIRRRVEWGVGLRGHIMILHGASEIAQVKDSTSRKIPEEAVAYFTYTILYGVRR